MIKKSQIENLINIAESKLEECWELLAAMRSGKLSGESGTSLIKFQPNLAQIIFDLSKAFRKIEQEKNLRIKNKKLYSTKWFRVRMQFLSRQQKIINNAIGIAKGIGDAFALFFYQNDRSYILEHLKLQPQLHAPPGIGGIGELEFIKNVRLFNKHFVIYHGNTNILRLGDFTLIDLENLRVAGIGELKSQSGKPGKLEVILIVSGPIINKLNNTGTALSETKQANFDKELSPKGRARLERQIKTYANSYKKLGILPNKKLNLEIKSQMKIFSDYIDSIKNREFKYIQLGKSIVIAGCKETRNTLYNKLSTPRKPFNIARLKALNNYVSNIVVQNRDDNSVFVGSFYYDENSQTHYMPGMTHMVWWPMSDSSIRSILFQEIITFRMFNPLHLVSSLEAAGFSIEDAGKLNYKVSKVVGKYEFGIEGMSHYFRMIQDYLFTEEDILAFLKQTEEQAKELASEKPLKINLHIEQFLGQIPIP